MAKINLWTIVRGEKVLTKTFLMLEALMKEPKLTRDLKRMLSIDEKDFSFTSYNLIQKGLIKKKMIINGHTGRPMNIYYITKSGHKEYIRLRRRFIEEVHPKFVN